MTLVCWCCRKELRAPHMFLLVTTNGGPYHWICRAPLSEKLDLLECGGNRPTAPPSPPAHPVDGRPGNS